MQSLLRCLVIMCALSVICCTSLESESRELSREKRQNPCLAQLLPCLLTSVGVLLSTVLHALLTNPVTFYYSCLYNQVVVLGSVCPNACTLNILNCLSSNICVAVSRGVSAGNLVPALIDIVEGVLNGALGPNGILSCPSAQQGGGGFGGK